MPHRGTFERTRYGVPGQLLDGMDLVADGGTAAARAAPHTPATVGPVGRPPSAPVCQAMSTMESQPLAPTVLRAPSVGFPAVSVPPA